MPAKKWIIIALVVVLAACNVFIGYLLSTQGMNLAQTESQIASLAVSAGLLESQLSESQEKSSALQAELIDLEAKLGTNRPSQINSSDNSTNSLRYFPDVQTLKAWLASQPVLPRSVDNLRQYEHALILQEAAAKDGYIISSVLNWEIAEEVYNSYNEAVLADNSLYWWDPDYRELKYWLDIDKSYIPGKGTPLH